MKSSPPSQGLTRQHLTTEAFRNRLRQAIVAAEGDDSLADFLHILSVNYAPMGKAAGIVSGAGRAESSDRITGHQLITVDWQRDSQPPHTSRFLLKSKVPGTTVRDRLATSYERFDSVLPDQLRRQPCSTYDRSHLRELAIARLREPTIDRISPRIYSIWEEREEGLFALLMEVLDDVTHLHTLDDLDAWTDRDIQVALDGISTVHGRFTGQVEPLFESLFLERHEDLNQQPLIDFHGELLRYCADHFPERFDRERVARIAGLHARAEERWAEIRSFPFTLIHGDFTPRNVCLRAAHGSAGPQLCAYDWELAQANIPQRDLCQFLCYVAHPAKLTDPRWLSERLESARQAQQKEGSKALPPEDFEAAFSLALQDFAAHSILIQAVSHQMLGKSMYFERGIENVFGLLRRYQNHRGARGRRIATSEPSAPDAEPRKTEMNTQE